MRTITDPAALGRRRSILVVEDNTINREMLCAALEPDFDVYQAKNGLEGLELLERHHEGLSLVLLDIYMPVCDGVEFLRRRREDERLRAVPVVVATASTAMKDEIRCLELGANDFVVKPYNFDVILNRINNIIELRETASIVNQLTYDDLTGLYNKEFFYRHAAQMLSDDSDGDYCLVCSDIGKFRMVNDHYGHDRCDRLLRDLASCLMERIPRVVIGGRIGGDQFAFLMQHDGTHGHSWEDELSDIPTRLGMPNLSIKLGVVHHVDHAFPIAQSCDRAMMALEQVKNPLGVGVADYDDELREREFYDRAIVESVGRALEDGQFTVRYQPKHDVRRDAVGGAEALVYWTHPEYGFVSPGTFIPILERSGLITELDMHVWDEACRELRRCNDLGLPVVPISINASRLDFDVPDLAGKLAELADSYGIDRSLLHVELTETAYSDSPDAVAAALQQLRDAGFGIELDDFGSGYSSMVSLATLPLDVMKIDMSIIRQASKLGDYRIVESTVQLAQILGIASVVEGVEHAEEVEKLREFGCDYIQGYYYSQPLTRDDFEAYLARR